MRTQPPIPCSIDRREFVRSIVLAGMSATVSADDMTVDDAIVQALGNAELSLRYRGGTAADLGKWRIRFREKLEMLLGDSTPPKSWTVLEEERHELEDHVRYSVMLQANGIPSVPVYLLIPKKSPKGARLPAVVCLHGHGAFGNHPIVGRTDLDGVSDEIAKNHYDYGLQFVRRGYVVAAPCLIPFGRRVKRQNYGGNDPCAVTFVRMQALGQLPMTANLRDIRWTVDYLSKRDEVLPDRIGCAGLSYGGRMTMLAAAMDERIRVASISGALNLLQERMSARHSCGSQIIPGLLKYGDFAEIGSLIAPRPCVWETGSQDPLIVPRWDELFRTQLRLAYRSTDAADNLLFDRFEGGHVWSGRIAYALFDKVLKS